MDIRIRRRWFTDKTSCGLMSIDGTYECFSLEDVARPNGVKIPGKTCIPPGEYPVTVDQSTRFKRLMPLISNIPGFEGVRIHAGNGKGDTSGCVLVGGERGQDTIWASKDAFQSVFNKIKAAYDRGEPICLTVTNEPV